MQVLCAILFICFAASWQSEAIPKLLRFPKDVGLMCSLLTCVMSVHTHCIRSQFWEFVAYLFTHLEEARLSMFKKNILWRITKNARVGSGLSFVEDDWVVCSGSAFHQCWIHRAQRLQRLPFAHGGEWRQKGRWPACFTVRWVWASQILSEGLGIIWGPWSYIKRCCARLSQAYNTFSFCVCTFL